MTLADALGMETTAEGAETEDEIELIRRLGCSHIQGFYYGPPMEQAEVSQKMGSDGAAANAVGHKTSRAPRRAILRRARLHLANSVVDARMRNISESGAMVEVPGFIDPGTPAILEIVDGPKLNVTSIWWADKRCGLAFEHVIDLGWLAANPGQMLRRAI